jgi:hypothetical protein
MLLVFSLAAGLALADEIKEIEVGPHGPTVFVPVAAVGSRVQGDDCTDPIPLTVSSLPVTFSGYGTCGRGNTYTETCLGSYDGGEDIIFEVTITYDMTVNITVDSYGTTWTGVAIDTACPPGNPCLAFSTSSSAIETIEEVELIAGTYYIMVDTWPAPDCIPEFDLTFEEPPPPPEEDGSICDFTTTCYEWDFAVSDHGFVPMMCDDGVQVWEYGTTSFVPDAPGNVWGTVLEGNYLNSAGDGLLSPAFLVETGVCDWLEVQHYIHSERFSPTSTLWDGCNVTVNGVVIPPLEGYSGVASTSAVCVGNEEVLGGMSGEGPIRTWGKACFDLSQFAGETIQVSFDFGSDGSVTYPGWYLAYVKVGTTVEPIPTENQTWGTLKSLYR